MAQEATTTDLALPEATQITVSFRTPGGIEGILAAIESDVRSQVLDVTTAKGRAAITSLAYKVSRSKTALDETGKSLTDEQRRQIEAVDLERRKVRTRLDGLRDEVRRPLVAWEEAEAKRISRISFRISDIRSLGVVNGLNYDQINARIEAVDAITVGDEEFGEFCSEAKLAKSDASGFLLVAHKNALAKEEADRQAAEAAEELRRQNEAQQAEIKRLKEEADERDRKAAEQAAKAEEEAAARKKAADDKAFADEQAELDRQREQQKAEAERQRLISENDALQKKIADQEAQRIADETERKLAAEREAEKERLQEEARAREEAAAKQREKDLAARKKVVRKDIRECLGAYLKGQMVPEALDAIAEDLIAGKIPHTTVELWGVK